MGVDRVNLTLANNTMAVRVDIRDGGGGRDIGTGTTLRGIESLNFFGGVGNETVLGGALSDLLQARGGSDLLSGGAGDDFLYGNIGGFIADAGTDTMTGGTGSDRFGFEGLSNLTESPPGAGRDKITDFVAGTDKILLAVEDVSWVIWLGGNQRFTRTEHELRFVNKLGVTLVEYDYDGDGFADLQVELKGALTLAFSDFEFY